MVRTPTKSNQTSTLSNQRQQLTVSLSNISYFQLAHGERTFPALPVRYAVAQRSSSCPHGTIPESNVRTDSLPFDSNAHEQDFLRQVTRRSPTTCSKVAHNSTALGIPRRHPKKLQGKYTVGLMMRDLVPTGWPGVTMKLVAPRLAAYHLR